VIVQAKTSRVFSIVNTDLLPFTPLLNSSISISSTNLIDTDNVVSRVRFRHRVSMYPYGQSQGYNPYGNVTYN